MSLKGSLKLIAVLCLSFAATMQAQVNNVVLTQTKGEFTEKSLTLTPGDYKFEIANNGVDHEVGFVLAPKGKTDQANHIKEAYVTKPVANGMSSMTQVVSLAEGDYVYFCPLNPTEQYDLTVKAEPSYIKLVQTKGEFMTKSLMLEAGDYMFEIENKNVGHDVGFVLAPKGKTDQANHIKEAYVTKPVATGMSSMTNIVSLTPGTYVYFCPLNKTAEYELVVK